MLRAMSFAIALAALIAPTPTIAGPRRLTEVEHLRFLQEQEDLAREVAEWKNSQAGKYAQDNDLVPLHTPHDVQFDAVPNANSSAVNSSKHDDELHRFFLTKLAVEKAQQENPEAKFSTDTPFSLMTDEEFAKYVGETNKVVPGGHLKDTMQVQEMPSWYSFSSAPQADAPSGSKDWTTSGCVSPPRQQGQCGSCWAFSAISVLETANCLKTGKLQAFSEQFLVSCDNKNHGCGGGYGTTALNFVKQNGGICSADSYPYASGNSRQNGQCDASKCQKVNLAIQNLVQPQPTEQGFLQALDKMPMIVAVSASSSVWKQYRGGVVSSCPSAPLNHAVTAVGYGTSGQSTYYKIKNSWGTQWGDGGYIMLSRQGSTCGILNRAAVYPVI